MRLPAPWRRGTRGCRYGEPRSSGLFLHAVGDAVACPATGRQPPKLAGPYMHQPTILDPLESVQNTALSVDSGALVQYVRLRGRSLQKFHFLLSDRLPARRKARSPEC